MCFHRTFANSHTPIRNLPRKKIIATYTWALSNNTSLLFAQKTTFLLSQQGFKPSKSKYQTETFETFANLQCFFWALHVKVLSYTCIGHSKAMSLVQPTQTVCLGHSEPSIRHSPTRALLLNSNHTALSR